MYRPPRPRMMNNFHQGPMPYNHHWRPNNGPSSRFPWNSPPFRPPGMRVGNSEEHWCETCDRGFPTIELLQKHKQQHQKCNIDGCQFIAHPKVITKHIQMQHSTGLYKKIANLNNPEDIQKWRDERKKKYPTKSNIEKKAAECKEKIERGEKMALKQVHRNRNDSCGPRDQRPGNKRKHSFDKRNQNQRMTRQNFRNKPAVPTDGQPAKKTPRIIPSAPTTAEKNKLKPFSGILSIEMNQETEDADESSECNNEIFDDDEESLAMPEETDSTPQPVLCGALSSLMCDYGTSDEETDEKENELVIKLPVILDKIPVEPPANNTNEIEIPKEENKVTMPAEDKTKSIVNNESDDDGPEEVKIVKTNVEHETDQETVPTNKEKPVKQITPPRYQEKPNYNVKRKIPSTLLQKLLHREIRQERNIILQCIRYIRKNNYFE